LARAEAVDAHLRLEVDELPVQLFRQVARRQENVIFPLEPLAQRLRHLHFPIRLAFLANDTLNRFFPCRQNVILNRPDLVSSDLLRPESASRGHLELVRAEELEPPRLSPPEPKSGASTNSATPALAAPPRARRHRALRRALYQLVRFTPEKRFACDSRPYGRRDGDGEDPRGEQENGCAVRRL